VAHRQSFRQPAFAGLARGEKQTQQMVIGKHLSEERIHGSANDFDKCVELVCMVPGSVGGRVLRTRWRLPVQRTENDLSQKNNAISLFMRAE